MSLRRYIGPGVLVGFVAGAIEAALVNRTGLPPLPYTALVYGLLTGLGFLLLALLGRVLRRDLVPFGIGLSITFFAFLEVAFWLNKRSPLRAGSPKSMIVNMVVLAAGIAVGVWVALAYRKRVRGTILFRPAILLMVIAVVGLAAFSGASYLRSQPGPNLVLISIDALRADHLACYGYHRDTAPNIDRLAAEGTLFLRAFTPCPGSTGGHASMLTGLYTLSHGAYVNGVMLPPEAPTAAEILKDNAYSTGAFVKNWYISPAVGFGQGFDCFIENAYGIILKSASRRLLARGTVLSQAVRRLRERPGFPTSFEIEDALEWVRFRRNHRFFLFLHIMDAHSPYIPPPEFAGRFGDAVPDAAYIQSLHDKTWEEKLSPEEVAFLIDRYDEEILATDNKIGMLLEELERLGLEDNTLVVLTADHGEVMGESEHKQFGHGTLDQGSLRIPLIMWWPGKIPGGDRRGGTVQSVDILPTALDLLGIDDRTPRQGLSLFRTADSATYDRPAFATGDLSARDEYTVITTTWQYTILGEEAGLYDIGTDPSATHNVIEEYPAVAESLQAVLQDWVDKGIAEAVVPFSLEGRSVSPGKEAVQRLKALGYIQ